MHGRITGYALVGITVLLILFFLGRYALRQTPPEPTTAQTEPVKPEPLRRARPASHPAELPAETPVAQLEDSPVTNAATLYRQAITIFDALSRDEKSMLGYWPTNIDASVEARLCGKIHAITDLMHQAGTLTNCDWGIEQAPRVVETSTLKSVPLSSIWLGRIAVWSAAHCRGGVCSEAVSDLVAAERLGRNMPRRMISHLVNIGIHGIAQDFVAKHASTFAFSSDPRLAELFEPAQFDEGFYRSLEAEKDWSAEPFEKMSAEERRVLAQVFPQTQSMDVKQLIECFRQIGEWQTEYVKALQLPESEYQDWLARFHEAEKTNPLLESFVTGSASAVAKTQYATIRNAMVGAGLAVVRDGEGALRTHPDPSTGQPFIYTETPDGFELQSGYQNTNLPALKMQFK